MVKVVTPRGTRCSRDPGAPAGPASHCNALQELILIQIFLRPVKGGLAFSMKWTMALAAPDVIFFLGYGTFKRPSLLPRFQCFRVASRAGLLLLLLL